MTNNDYTTIVDHIYSMTTLFPNRKALKFNDCTITYAQLDKKVTTLVHHLINSGVQPGEPVGLYFYRSIEMVVSMLAVLKAGAYFVPIDPDSPEKRIDYIISNTALSTIITNAISVNQNERLKTNDTLQLLISDDLPVNDVSLDAANKPGPEDIAYVLYTSGSTGDPKGVMIPHKGLLNRLLWMKDEFAVDEHEQFLQKTPYTFDVSLWEFFLPLISGATLVIAEPGGHKNSEYLKDIITREHISIIHFVPSMLQIFLEEKKIESCTSLKNVVCSGEALPYALQMAFYDKFSCNLYNLYGPTEASIDVTSWKCSPDAAYDFVPIGHPIWNTQIYIIDEDGSMMPNGEAGEIYIGGVGLAKGYLHNKALTDKAFVYNDTVGEILYKTGDYGRIHPDGVIEYIGRKDFQIQLFGTRIELGEIESLLLKYPGVKNAAVLIHEISQIDKRLIACVITDDPSASPADYKHYLKDFLAPAAIPSQICFYDTFPLSPNGKVDRKQLLQAVLESQPTKTSKVVTERPMHNTLTNTIVSLWNDVLQSNSINLDDNFFDIGGNSLLFSQLHRKLTDTIPKQVSFIELFEYTTINAQVNFFSKASGEAVSRNKVENRINRQRKSFRRKIRI